MEYSDELLSEIEKYAELLLPLRDIAILVDVDPAHLRLNVFDPAHPAYKAYHRGKMRTVVQLRANEIELAKTGSPQAVENASNLLKEMNCDEI